MIMTDIQEAKSVLQIDPLNTNEDKNILFYIEWASAIIEEYLNRPGLTYQSRTEYYSGTGTQKLLLNSRPVFTTPTIQCYVDGSGFYGSASGAFTATNSQLTYGTDFCLAVDQSDGTSRSGILVRMNNYWLRPTYRQPGLLSPFIGEAFGNIKVVYSGGYTVDTLPASFRVAANLLIAKLRYIFPLGVELQSESYEERNIALTTERKDYLMNLVKPILFSYRNWRF